MNSRPILFLLHGEWTANLSLNSPIFSGAFKFSPAIVSPNSSDSPSLAKRTITPLSPLAQLKTAIETERSALKKLKDEVEKQRICLQKWEIFLQWAFQYPKYLLEVNKDNLFPIFKTFIFNVGILQKSSGNTREFDQIKDKAEFVSKSTNTFVLFVFSCLKVYFIHSLEKKVSALIEKQKNHEGLILLEKKESSSTQDLESVYYLNELKQIKTELGEVQALIHQERMKAEAEIYKPKNLFRPFSLLIHISTSLINSSCKIVLKIAKPLYNIQDANEELKKIALLRKKQNKILTSLPLKQIPASAPLSSSLSVDSLKKQTENKKEKPNSPLTDSSSLPCRLSSLLRKFEDSVVPSKENGPSQDSVETVAEDLADALKSEKIPSFLMDEKKQRIKKRQAYLSPHIQQCEHLCTGQEIQCYVVRNFGVDLQELPFTLPQDKQAWLEVLKSPHFHSLADKRICELEREETKAILLQQGLYQALLSKHKREAHYLSLQEFENIMGIVFSSLQLMLIPLETCLLPLSLLKFFMEELVKLAPMLGISYLVFPDYKLKVESLLFLTIDCVYSRQYKPHEYSLKGYELSLKKRGIIALTYLLELKYLCETMLRNLKVYFVKGGLFPSKQTPEEREKCKKEISELIEKNRLYWKDYLSHFEEDFKILREQDAAILISPTFKKTQPKEDVFDLLQEEISQIDFTRFPEIKGWLEKNLKLNFEDSKTQALDLKNRSADPKIKQHLSQFFAKECSEFLNT